MSSPYACLICPALRRLRCVVACTPEIAGELTRTDVDLDREETAFRFVPPVKPSRGIKPFFREEGLPQRVLRRPENKDCLR